MLSPPDHTHSLYTRICRKLNSWEFPTWPSGSKEVLVHANRITSELLPYIHAASAMCMNKMGLYGLPNDLAFQVLTRTETLKNKFLHWINTVPFNQLDPGFFATYKIETNRLSNLFQFIPVQILNQFQIHRKSDSMLTIRLLCLYFGSPWSSVQKREVNGKSVHVLCVPNSMVNYGL